MRRLLSSALVVSVSLVVASAASAQVVFEAQSDNGFFTPFNAGNAATVIYGDGGWIGTGGDAPATLGQITLGLAIFNSLLPGTTDIVFTFNDGDPSGLVFGSGAVLYSTVIRGVKLPATGRGAVEFLSLPISLPNVQTAGGYNDIGWSVALANFDYAGDFGFQASTCAGQTAGFYTNNASYFDGSAWSLFSFGPGCDGVGNLVATIELAEPSACPADLDGSSIVDAADLSILLGAWGGPGSADLDGSGAVDAADLGVLLGGWGSCG
jgi:hypothetical protein